MTTRRPRLAGLALVAATALPAQSGPLEEATAWVRQHGAPFATVEAGGALDDLAPVVAMVGDARIVGLGEGTHGSREFFQMKHRLTELLVREKGFSIFAIEASMPEAYRLNDWVLGGDGDPKELIRGMYFWTWCTEEVLALVQWMRAYNESGAGPVQFTGFDMQHPEVAGRTVREWVTAKAPELAAQLRPAWDELERSGRPRFRGPGAASAEVPAERVAGKVIVLSGAIRTDAVSDRAALWCRADAGGKYLAFEELVDEATRGTTDWKRYRVELEIPANAERVVLGVLLRGSGQAWFDDLALEIDGEVAEVPAGLDFDFEGDALGGFQAAPGAYRVAGDLTQAAAGERSLLIERAEEPGASVSPEQSRRRAREVLDALAERRSSLVEQHPERDVDWVIQNARVVWQCMRTRAGHRALRDESMAENVAWIAAQNPDAKIVLWAHNGHVARDDGWMGQHLAAEFGDDYLPVAFATAGGQYRAMSPAREWIHDLAAPPEGSVEAVVAAAGQPRLALDLRGAPPWFGEEHPFRSIGGGAMEKQFYPTAVAERFDLLVWIERTAATVSLQ